MYLDKHPHQYIPDDPTTHKVHYIESIMTPDGKVYYLTLGAHLDNALYICLGGSTWDFYGMDRVSYKSIPEEYHTADVYQLCHEFGIASIHDSCNIVYDHITEAMYRTFFKMYYKGHISEAMYNQIKSNYYKGR